MSLYLGYTFGIAHRGSVERHMRNTFTLIRTLSFTFGFIYSLHYSTLIPIIVGLHLGVYQRPPTVLEVHKFRLKFNVVAKIGYWISQDVIYNPIRTYTQ